jgi:hypothetical protein
MHEGEEGALIRCSRAFFFLNIRLIKLTYVSHSNWWHKKHILCNLSTQYAPLRGHVKKSTQDALIT